LIAGNPVTAYEAGNCPDCVEFNAGGFWEEKVLISGLIQTWSDSKEAQRLMRLFLSSIRKHFKEKINAFWIGPEAYEFLVNGGRITQNTDAAPSLDMKVPDGTTS
jgi:hypothetical protein